MVEKSLVLIKPDGVEREIIGNIISVYEDNGLKVQSLKLMNATREIAEKHYFEHKDKPFFEDLIAFITRGPLVAIILEGEDAISRIRSINGATNPNEASPGTIRHKYGRSKTENVVHASDSKEKAKEEIALWFNECK